MNQLHYLKILEFITKKNSLTTLELFCFLVNDLKFSKNEALNSITLLLENPLISYDGEVIRLINK